jgi:hypothetical protein
VACRRRGLINRYGQFVKCSRNRINRDPPQNPAAAFAPTLARADHSWGSISELVSGRLPSVINLARSNIRIGKSLRPQLGRSARLSSERCRSLVGHHHESRNPTAKLLAKPSKLRSALTAASPLTSRPRNLASSITPSPQWRDSIVPTHEEASQQTCFNGGGFYLFTSLLLCDAAIFRRSRGRS